jgi:hypothetical protein
MHPSRRSLVFLSAATVALAATGCAGTTPSQLASDVQLIASGLASAAAALMQVPGVPAATLTQLQGYLDTIKADAAAVASGPSGATGTVQEIASTVQVVASIALPLIPGGSAIVAIVEAAVSLLPAILAAVGISGTTGAVAVYTPDQARLILRAAPGSHRASAMGSRL